MGCVPNADPAVAPEGCVVNTSWLAASEPTLKLDELTPTAPGPESVPAAFSVCAPEVSIRRFVNVATPATAVFVTVPWSEPPPVLIEAVTSIVESAPVVMTFPNASSTLTTGCVPKLEPAVAPDGCVVKTSWLAAAVLTVKLDELTLTAPGPESVPLALSVCAPDVSIRRLVSVATPAT